MSKSKSKTAAQSLVAPTPRPGDVAFCRLMWRLQMASHKLDLAAAYWKVPATVCSEDLGAVMTVHEVARELDGLYCRFVDLIREHGLYEGSLWADSFDEGAPEPAYQGGAHG